MSAVLLFHDEMLSPQHPLLQLHPTVPRIYIFDDVQIQREGLALKRLQFIADALVEIPEIRVYRGDLIQVLERLGVSCVVTQATPQSWLRDALAAHAVEWYEPPPFARFTGRLRRFSAYWKVVESQVLNGGK